MKYLFLKLKSPATALFGYVLSGAVFAVANAAETLPRIPVTSYSDIRSTVLCQVAIGIFEVCIALTVVFVVVAAYKYLTSSGDPEKVKSATKTITYAAVAVVVALLASNFPTIVAKVFGVEDVLSGC